MLLQLFVSNEKDINLTVDDKINYSVPRCADKLGSFSQTNSLKTACNVICKVCAIWLNKGMIMCVNSTYLLH